MQELGQKEGIGEGGRSIPGRVYERKEHEETPAI